MRSLIFREGSEEKEIPDKVFRRVLKVLKDPNLNQLCRKHGIDLKLDRDAKINQILNQGISLRSALSNGIYKDDVTKTDRKAFLNDLVEKRLLILDELKGATLGAKIDIIIDYFERKESDGSLSISLGGYDKLLGDLSKYVRGINNQIRSEFELQEGEVMKAKTLLTYSLKPIDILTALPDDIIKSFCEKAQISTRGNQLQNILDRYKDVGDLYIENYMHIASRNLPALGDNGLEIKEAELGIKFEEVTKSIFAKLGFNVDNKCLKEISDSNNRADIILRESDSDIVIIECKSIKEKG
ncbi:MAG: hypothetical protein IPL65_17110 [Lewinellaceae bacterium]|nr:hypothetical protein [Lewinellaceae bacterium]